MDKWDLKAIKDQLEENPCNPARLHLTMRALLDLMIDEATKKDDVPDYEPYWGGQD
jgi:hypothetical protein